MTCKYLRALHERLRTLLSERKALRPLLARYRIDLCGPLDCTLERMLSA